MKAYIPLSAVPMRAEPSHRSEMVNQLLFGDTADILQPEEEWTLLRSHYDGYQGWVHNKQFVPFDSAADLAERGFLGTPYLWGGRSQAGIDCSGLSQVCFKALGIWLPRDASVQATVGTLLPPDATPMRDDLAFFQENGRIIHVGICLGDGRIIHSSGRVRIDTLDSKGIYDGQKYTHLLHSIRRPKA